MPYRTSSVPTKESISFRIRLSRHLASLSKRSNTARFFAAFATIVIPISICDGIGKIIYSFYSEPSFNLFPFWKQHLCFIFIGVMSVVALGALIFVGVLLIYTGQMTLDNILQFGSNSLNYIAQKLNPEDK